MVSRSLAIGVLAVGLIAGAGAGAYVAVRQQTPPAQPIAVAAPAPVEHAAPSTQPVAETEAVVTPPAADGAKPAAPSAPARPVIESKRAEVSRPRTPVAAIRQGSEHAREPRRTVVPPQRPARAPSVAATAATPVDEPARDLEAARPPARDPRDVNPPASSSRPAAAVVAVEAPATPPAPQFEEIVIPASSVIGLRVETAVTSERAQVEDRVEARVTRDVMADGRVAVPAGARAIGSVTLVERGGKMKDRARLGVRFHTLVLEDGTELPLNTEAIYREGESPTGESARKIGGAAVGGAILGALIGGKKGAIVGGATGAAGGTAVVMAGDRNAATLPSGTVVTIRLAAPVGVEVEKR